MAHPVSTLNKLPNFQNRKKTGFSFVRAHPKAQSKTSMAKVKKLMKLVQSDGKAVSGVMIGPDGAVSVTIADAQHAKSATANPWDAELS